MKISYLHFLHEFLIYDLYTTAGALSNSKVFDYDLAKFSDLIGDEEDKCFAMIRRFKEIVDSDREDNLLLQFDSDALKAEADTRKGEFEIFILNIMKEYEKRN